LFLFIWGGTAEKPEGELAQKPTFSSITQSKLNCLGW